MLAVHCWYYACDYKEPMLELSGIVYSVNAGVSVSKLHTF